MSYDPPGEDSSIVANTGTTALPSFSKYIYTISTAGNLRYWSTEQINDKCSLLSSNEAKLSFSGSPEGVILFKVVKEPCLTSFALLFITL
jgi:hypothetical protein